MADPEDAAPGPIPRVPRDEVRRRLRAAAIQVFAERGYAEARLSDIAHAAGFTKGAVYSNFTGKRQLFGEILSAGSAREFDAVVTETADADDPEVIAHRLASLVAGRIVTETDRGRLGLEFATHATRDTDTRSALAEIRRRQRAAVASLVSALAERGMIRPDVDPEDVALAIHCLTNGLSMEHLVDPDEVDMAAVERALVTVLSRFLVVSEPRGGE